MAINEREHHIKVLEYLLSHYKAREQCEGYYDSTLKDSVEALQYAISSLNTDEAYQLEYEHIPYITLDELKEIREEIRKKKLLYTHPHELAKNVYREAMNNVLAILDKTIAELENR